MPNEPPSELKARVRWRIRTKLLVLLLAIALLPLVFLTLIDYRTIRDLGRDLAAKAHVDLAHQARAQLGLVADNYALLLQRETEVLELLVRQQAREVELRLAGPAPVSSDTVVFDTDIDRQDPRLNLMPSRKHLRRGDADAGMAVPVSYDTQAFRLPSGASASDFRDALQRMNGLTEIYRSLHQRHDNLIFWQYTTLESGLHCVYPAHGGYPQGYEPRWRPWYLRQRGSKDLLWHPPLIDASTQQAIVTVSMPVFGPDRKFAGVTAIDVSIIAYLAGLPLPSGWAEDSSVFLVTPIDKPDTEDDAIRILTRQTYDIVQQEWKTDIASDWISPPHAGQRLQLVTDMSERRSGMLQARYGSGDALWAYRPIGDSGTWLLIILPYTRAVAMASMAREEALAHTRVQLQTTLAIGVPLILAAVLAALWSAGAISRPVQQLVEATHRVTSGDFEARTHIHTGDELETLGRAFNDMVPLLKDRVRHAEGIRLAREVQQNLIPATPRQWPDLDVAGVSIYCEETGGDYYDFLELGSTRDRALGVAIGDVSGHGVSSALLMTTARALLHAFAPQSRTLSETMCAINERLADDVHEGRFMTLYYLVVEPLTRTLRWISAGHDPAFVYRVAEDAFAELAGDDIPLGVDGNWHYRECVPFTCRPGDVVMMCTDGVWETSNAAGDKFGKERLQALLRAHAGNSAADICGAVTATLRDFRGREPQKDDLTVVVIRLGARAP